MPAKRIEFHDEAADAAFDWYLERSPDSACKFDAEVQNALSQIGRAPERWARGSFGTRRYLLSRFPFVVIYRTLTENTTQVVAVAHTSRRPGYWKQRL